MKRLAFLKDGDESHTTAGVQVQVGLPLGQTNQSLTIQSIIHGLAAADTTWGLDRISNILKPTDYQA